MTTTERFGWGCDFRLEKRRGLYLPDCDHCAIVEPYEVLEGSGNVLLYGGASVLWDRLTEGSPTIGVLDSTNAVIGVGTSATAAAATQTNLQAADDASNRYYKTVAAQPTHTDGTTSAAATCTFSSSFGTSVANFAWAEFVIGRGTQGAGGTAVLARALNRRVFAFGTKTSSDTWTLTVALTIAGSAA